MERNFVKLYFKVTIFTLNCAAAFIYNNPIHTSKNFVVKKVWPVVVMTMWIPLFTMAFAKVGIYASEKNWEGVLEMMFVLIVAVDSYYCIFVVQLTSKHFKTIMTVIESTFVTFNDMTLADCHNVLPLWALLLVSFVVYLSGCVYYGDTPVALWVPFARNDFEVHLCTWTMEILFIPFVMMTFVFWGPFLVISTTCICKELNHLIDTFKSFQFSQTEASFTSQVSFNNTETRTRMFIGSFVERHVVIKRYVSNNYDV